MKEANKQSFLDRIRGIFRVIRQGLAFLGRRIKAAFRRFRVFLRRKRKNFMRKFTKWIDPKLETYRPKPSASSSLIEIESSGPKYKLPRHAPADSASEEDDPPQAEIVKKSSSDLADTPTTRADLLAIIQSAPLGVFARHERDLMSTVLNLPNLRASEVMLPASKIVYVKSDEVMGPLTLDRLYRSGFAHFPVINQKDEIIGTIHTTHLNNLDIRDSSRAEEILDPGIYYIREDYTLEQVMDAFLRTNCYFFLVVDKYGRIIGILNFTDFCKFLFGRDVNMDFERDNDRLAVANRQL